MSFKCLAECWASLDILERFQVARWFRSSSTLAKNFNKRSIVSFGYGFHQTWRDNEYYSVSIATVQKHELTNRQTFRRRRANVNVNEYK